MPRVISKMRTSSFTATETLPKTFDSISSSRSHQVLQTSNSAQHSSPKRNKPTQHASFSVGTTDLGLTLPTRSAESYATRNTSEGNSSNNSSSQNAKTSRTFSYRASEKGRGDVLPMTSSPAPMPIRQRIFSSDGLAGRSGLIQRSRTSDENTMSAMARHSVRHGSRRRTLPADSDDEGISRSPPDQRYIKPGKSDSDFSQQRRANGTTSLMHQGYLGWNQKGANEKFSQLTTALGIIFVLYFVLESYYRALEATEQLTSFKRQESRLMVHLHHLEQTSLAIHENLSRLAARGVDSAARDVQATGDVDVDLITKQINRAKDLERELSIEVSSLEKNIQRDARLHLVESYGEGPVQAVFELETSNGNVLKDDGKISILLWQDTPHAVWTLLQQINDGAWNGSTFHIEKGRELSATAAISMPDKRLEFVETSTRRHEAWTVGLNELEDGAVGIFVNIQDNSELHKRDACVGKVLDGFGVLQQMVDLTRADETQTVTVKSVAASHLAKADNSGIFR